MEVAEERGRPVVDAGADRTVAASSYFGAAFGMTRPHREERRSRAREPASTSIVQRHSDLMLEDPTRARSEADGTGSYHWLIELHGGLRTYMEWKEYNRELNWTEMPIFPSDCKLIAIYDGKQTHTIAEYLLRDCERTDWVRMTAYTFDHPTVAEMICEAVRTGAVVNLTINYEEVYGRTNSAYCKRVLKGMKDECAGRRGRLELYAKKGFDQIPVYAHYDRTLGGPREKVGAQHSKLFYKHPFLIMGSTNWSVSSETNWEYSSLIRVGESAKPMINGIFDRIENNAKRVQPGDLNRA